MEHTFGYFVTPMSARRAEQIYEWMGQDEAAANRSTHENADDGSISVPVRFAGGAVRVCPESHPTDENFVMVALDMPGQNPIPLFLHEAAALGQALVDLAYELMPPPDGAIEMADLPDAIRAVKRAEGAEDD